jgi:hypothetical protein
MLVLESTKQLSNVPLVSVDWVIDSLIAVEPIAHPTPHVSRLARCGHVQ